MHKRKQLNQLKQSLTLQQQKCAQSEVEISIKQMPTMEFYVENNDLNESKVESFPLNIVSRALEK